MINGVGIDLEGHVAMRTRTMDGMVQIAGGQTHRGVDEFETVRRAGFDHADGDGSACR